MPKVSVIVPVYNVEKYILQCLESIAAQTFRDFEVIIVNDGTPDKSAQIAEAFIRENKLENFRVIHKENGGLSSARNAGLEQASGAWITFVDSDDYVEPNYLSAMMEALERNPADLCIARYRAFDAETNREVFCNSPFPDKGRIPEDLDALRSFSYVWICCYKHEIIRQHGLRFDERVRYGEDNAFQFDYNSHIASFCAVNDIVYHYRYLRKGSMTAKVVRPQEKFYIYEHMEAFCNAYDPGVLMYAVQRNEHLSRVMWSALSAYVTSLILDGSPEEAKKVMQKPLPKMIVSAYTARDHKDRVFMALWKGPFAVFALVTRIYYNMK